MAQSDVNTSRELANALTTGDDQGAAQILSSKVLNDPESLRIIREASQMAPKNAPEEVIVYSNGDVELKDHTTRDDPRLIGKLAVPPDVQMKQAQTLADQQQREAELARQVEQTQRALEPVDPRRDPQDPRYIPDPRYDNDQKVADAYDRRYAPQQYSRCGQPQPQDQPATCDQQYSGYAKEYYAPAAPPPPPRETMVPMGPSYSSQDVQAERMLRMFGNIAGGIIANSQRGRYDDYGYGRPRYGYSQPYYGDPYQHRSHNPVNQLLRGLGGF